jgi:TolB-like protein
MMNSIRVFTALAICIAGWQSCAALAQPSTDPASLTIAVIDFDSDTPAAPQLGKQIGETLTATLSDDVGFTMVDRASMNKTLSEHSLNLTGLVNNDDAIKVGKLVGAKILVTGKVFMLDKQVFLTAKLIGTETSLVQGVVVHGDKDADMAPLILSLSEKISAKLRDAGPRLVAADKSATDPLPALKDRLSKLKLPKVTVNVQERHIAAGVPARIDPAVETELRQMLSDCGFTVIDGDEKQQIEQGVTVVISGEAFSEYASRIGNLVSCIGRAEIKITDRKSGQVLLSDRETARAVDLAENTAGKTALQKAGHALGIRVLRHFAETLPPTSN